LLRRGEVRRPTSAARADAASRPRPVAAGDRVEGAPPERRELRLDRATAAAPPDEVELVD
jgi:hypothetical protein